MEREQELAIIRRAYAKQVLVEWQVDDPRLELAFTQVRREDFLGPGPWVIPRWIGESRGRPAIEYVPTPSADPVYLYVDNVVQVIVERNLNNGQPSGHAKWITSASMKAGEHATKHRRPRSPKPSRRTTGNGSLACTGIMRMYPTTVVGFVARDGASPTNDVFCGSVLLRADEVHRI